MPYIVFDGPTNHGDGEILAAQQWLAGHFSVAGNAGATAFPVEEMIRRSRPAPRSFERRFGAATGTTPTAYVQRLRVEEAGHSPRIERTAASVDEISSQVGYEDPAFFRRLFRRVTGLAPGAYRRRFRIPDFARPHLATKANR